MDAGGLERFRISQCGFHRYDLQPSICQTALANAREFRNAYIEWSGYGPQRCTACGDRFPCQGAKLVIRG